MAPIRPLRFLVDLHAAWRRGRRQRKRANRLRVARAVAERHGPRVQEGPFAGLLYPWLEAGGSQLTPKLLGTYEEEVHPFLERILARGYETVVNIGCGEGYYAVGLAREMPGATVFAFDADPRSQRLCTELASANGVGKRVRVAGACGPERLGQVIRGNTLVVCDCEGCELDLLRPDLVPELLRCDLLVEAHRVKGVRSTADGIRARFADTHAAEIVRFRGRDPSAYSAVAFLPRSDRKVALGELRSRGLEWLLMERRGR